MSIEESKGQLWPWWHGTTGDKATSILVAGFQPCTYFANDGYTALCMGGPFVFGVLFPISTETAQWEYRPSERIGPERIYTLLHFERVRLLHYSSVEFRRLRQSFHAEIPICAQCNGFVDLNYADDGHHLLPGGTSFRKNSSAKFDPCPKCSIPPNNDCCTS